MQKPESTGYSALPSPSRLMQRAAAARCAETICNAADTHTDTQMPSDKYLRSLSGGKGNESCQVI